MARLVVVGEAFDALLFEFVADEGFEFGALLGFVLGDEGGDFLAAFGSGLVVFFEFVKVELDDARGSGEVGVAQNSFGCEEDVGGAVFEFGEGALTEFGLFVSGNRIGFESSVLELGSERVELIATPEKDDGAAPIFVLLHEHEQEIGLLVLVNLVDGMVTACHELGD